MNKKHNQFNEETYKIDKPIAKMTKKNEDTNHKQNYCHM